MFESDQPGGLFSRAQRFDNQHQNAAHNERRRHRPWPKKKRFDLLMKKETGHRGGQKTQEKPKNKRDAIGLSLPKAHAMFREERPVMDDDRKDGAKLNHDIKRIDTVAREVKKSAEKNQMAGRRDRKIL